MIFGGNILADKKIIMTGGGSAGHVTPNLAIIPGLHEKGYEVEYIGSRNGIEKKIIEDEKIKYHYISTGKIRRYFDLKNISDPFKVIKGIFQAYNIIRHEKPDIVFSKGGFVSVPVVIGAYFCKVPVIAHESDITPGLANKISIPYCTKVCVTFPETLKNIKNGKGILTGTPIRQQLLNGSKLKGKKICGFDNDKSVIMAIGGSLGAKFINDIIRENIKKLSTKYNVIHICGKNNIDKKYDNIKNYVQFEYLNDELADLYALSDIIVSRAGANVIFELLELKKPNILIPLSKKVSRGDQVLNAESFQKQGFSMVLQEEKYNSTIFMNMIEDLYNNKEKYKKNMKDGYVNNAVNDIINIIIKFTK